MSEYPWYIFILSLMGGFMLITSIVMMIWLGISEGIDKFKTTRRMKKRKYEIEHRFDKPPLAKCHCCDCRYGFATDIDNGDYKPIYRCDLAPNRKKYLYDSSFCSDAEEVL